MPVAGFTATPTCGASPLNVQFTDTSTNTPTSWSWDFGDGNTSTADNPTHQYTSATTQSYTVKLVATNLGGSSPACIQTNYITINPIVNVYPNYWSPMWSRNPTPISGGLSNLTAADSSFMDIRADSSANNYAVEYTAPTGYTPSQVSQLTITYVAKYTGALPDNNGEGVMYARKSDGTWEDIGGFYIGTSDTTFTWSTTNVSNYMDSSGNVGFTACWGCGVSSSYDILSDQMQFALTLTSDPIPVASFKTTSLTSGTGSVTVNFTDTSTGPPAAWSWNFGDGSTSTAQNPSHTFSAAGVYPVSLTVTNVLGTNTCNYPDYVLVRSSAGSLSLAATGYEQMLSGQLVSGTLSNIATEDNNCMVTVCDVADDTYRWNYYFATGYTAAD